MTPWFRPKKTGIGITPASPAGWVATALFLVALIGGRLLLDSTGRGVDQPYVFAVAMVVAAFALLVWRTMAPRA